MADGGMRKEVANDIVMALRQGGTPVSVDDVGYLIISRPFGPYPPEAMMNIIDLWPEIGFWITGLNQDELTVH